MKRKGKGLLLRMHLIALLMSTCLLLLPSLLPSLPSTLPKRTVMHGEFVEQEHGPAAHRVGGHGGGHPQMRWQKVHLLGVRNGCACLCGFWFGCQ